MLHNKQNITCPLVDMNFIFSCLTRYLTSEHSERVRYRVEHSKIKFISMRGHVFKFVMLFSWRLCELGDASYSLWDELLP